MLNLNPIAKARIYFFQQQAPDSGVGRKTPPPMKYRCESKFSLYDQPEWTLCMEFLSEPVLGQDMSAYIHYLMPNAPHANLVPGRLFTLYEGNVCVAKGVVE